MSFRKNFASLLIFYAIIDSICSPKTKFSNEYELTKIYARTIFKSRDYRNFSSLLLISPNYIRNCKDSSSKILAIVPSLIYDKKKKRGRERTIFVALFLFYRFCIYTQ